MTVVAQAQNVVSKSLRIQSEERGGYAAIFLGL
jgi:hypothetical protein